MKIINDKEEMRKFYERVMLPLDLYEVNFVSLSARNKYLTEEERKYYHITRAEMFARRLIRNHDFNKFYAKIAQFETETSGAWTTKSGMDIPNKALVCYVNINPSHSIKALKLFNDIINEQYMHEMCNVNGREKRAISDTFNKCDVTLMNCFQKSRGTKHWIDIDVDLNNKSEIQITSLNVCFKWLCDKGINFLVISTKSGYHILIKKSSLKEQEFNPYDFVEILKSILVNFYKEICINKNEMVPVPGTFHAQYPVKIVLDSEEWNDKGIT